MDRASGVGEGNNNNESVQWKMSGIFYHATSLDIKIRKYSAGVTSIEPGPFLGAGELVCLTSNFWRHHKISDVLERARQNVKRGRKRLFVTPQTLLTRVLSDELDNTHLRGWILIKTLVLLVARKLNYFLLYTPSAPPTPPIRKSSLHYYTGE